MPIDVERARRDTPATDKILHFNNAGAALMPTPVLQAQLRYLQLEADTGGYEAAAAEDDRIEAIYDSIARLLNADRAEIALVENATVAWDMAFYSIGFAPGDRILVAEAEYLSNQIAFQQVARRTGAVIDVVPSDEAGEFDVEALERMIDRRVKLIAVTHVPSNGGLVNPAAAVGRIARAHGILYLLDACQSVGQLPIDVAAIGCDMLSATGRKYLRGPRGTGFLYVRRGVLDRLEPPFLDLQSANWVAPDRYEMRPDARRFENWERNVAAQLGLGVAVDYALGWGLADIAMRIETLAAELRRRLDGNPGGQRPRPRAQALRHRHLHGRGESAAGYRCGAASTTHQLSSVGTEFDAARCPGAPVARSRARVRALLQHRGRGGALRARGRHAGLATGAQDRQGQGTSHP